ncbi:hypothetical protein BDZ45DRAFT_272657 [Acephala macrosclerotiorum]|nr:hypothetical protein BDZ45DRAFT_272657 [Acephala macrosclerotiorum]
MIPPPSYQAQLHPQPVYPQVQPFYPPIQNQPQLQPTSSTNLTTIHFRNLCKCMVHTFQLSHNRY